MTTTAARLPLSPGLRGSASLYVAGFNLKEIAAACALSGLIVSSVSILTNPHPTSEAPASITFVNRASKTDRLRLTPRTEQPKGSHTAPGAIRPKRNKLVGCESSVSHLIAPHVEIVDLCLT